MPASTISSPLAVRDRVLLAAIALLLVVTLAAGGSARADIPALLPLRLVAIVVLAVGLALPGNTDLRRVRPLQLLACLAIVALLQLVPLPPALWRGLPGHELAAAVADAAGLGNVWRPASLTPDLTLESLVSMLPPAAMLVCAYRLAPTHRLLLLPALAALAVLSGLAGVWQLAAAGDPQAYPYRISHFGWPTGAFANRNHQAVLMAIALPMLAAWTTLAPRPGQRRARGIAAIAVALFLAAMIVAAGSRAGLVLGAVAVLGSLAIVAPSTGGRRRIATLVLAGVAVSSMVAGVALAGRSAAFERLAAVDIGQEQRVVNTPLVIDLVGQFFPVGSGLGSFEPVFRIHETDAMLQRTFYNHAHNDVLELAMTGGLAAMLILTVFLVWLGRRVWSAASSDGPAVVKGAALAMTIILASSLVDYPLRTPLLAIIFAMLCSLIDATQERQVNY